MNILSIETSCDETAISLLKATGDFKHASFKILGNKLLSQIDIHRKYGGVYPSLAKREHAKNLVPILREVLEEAQFLDEKKGDRKLPSDTEIEIEKILEREPLLYEQFIEFISHIERPQIDAIAVTHGPGLEPALWVGINFAKALSRVWDIPIIPVNHMEGHIFSALLKEKNTKTTNNVYDISNIAFPILALLVSGGHTELVLMEDFGKYELIGKTCDDAAGEAFDKVARILGLPYPGGPEISKLAEDARKRGVELAHTFPRPMLRSGDFRFSFSGLKTAVLYYAKEQVLDDDLKSKIAKEFEDAVTEVLVEKTINALLQYKARTIALGGGVSANANLQSTLAKRVKKHAPDVQMLIPDRSLTTDNAIMIGVAGYFRHLSGEKDNPFTITAQGNLLLN